MLKVAFKYFDNKTAYVIEVLKYILSSLRKKDPKKIMKNNLLRHVL